MKKEYLECGKICSAHGVRGAVNVEHWCDSSKILASQNRVFFAEKDGGYKEVKVLSASSGSRYVIMTLEGIDTREAAQAEKNRILYLNRADIPLKKGTVLIADIIGLSVIDIDTGRVYGEVSEVNDGVQGKLYTVRTEAGDVILPGVGDFIKEIDTERGVFVRVIPGFFTE
ncbi:MAG: 16S rRNA processing protein RimM [Ruminococcaceae bacterium]|nr:16S rRNA processing protein RimM [Oscillospiraceae bacterium]